MQRFHSLYRLLVITIFILSWPIYVRAESAANALAALAAAHRTHPGDIVVTRALEKTVSNGLPEQIDPTLLPDLPVDIAPIPDSLGALVVPKPYLSTPATEPQHNATFGKITYIYIPTDSAEARQFCRLHYTTPDDAALAGRIGKLLALAHRTLVMETGHEAVNGTHPFDVWLCRNGTSGGEQWRDNIYFYDLDSPRSSIEWIREIVHEYSHMALPAIGGYKAPEYWANGYLGERLIVRWLARSHGGQATMERVWGDFSGYANFDHLLIAPALSLYKRIGPSQAWLARTDEDGMRYLIGQALTMDDKCGAHRLGEAFQQLPRFRETKAADLAAAFTEVVQEQSAPRSARRSSP